jgi:hypothetical protein
MEDVAESLRRERDALVVYLKDTAQTYEELALVTGEFFFAAQRGMKSAVADGRRRPNPAASERVENGIAYSKLLMEKARKIRACLDRMGESFTPDEEENGVTLPD